jgi:hypothetical protein
MSSLQCALQVHRRLMHGRAAQTRPRLPSAIFHPFFEETEAMVVRRRSWSEMVVEMPEVPCN